MQAMERLQEHLFLSTLSLRRATNIPLPNAHVISISIHALLAESDRVYVSYNQYNNTFLSTLSLRRATRTNDRKRDEKVNISIHALLAESDVLQF